MILTIHIIIALVGLASAVAASIKPNRNLIGASLLSITATVTTGTVLVLQGGSLLHVCIAGIVYTVLAGSLTAVGIIRLRQSSTISFTS